MSTQRHDVPVEKPPQWAEHLLRLVLRHNDEEAVLGDLQEEFRHRVASGNPRRANAEYWREVAASAPLFLLHRIETILIGRNQNMDTRSGVRQALLGLLLALPALLLVIGGVLQSTGILADDLAGSVGGPASGVLRTLQHPAAILGGLLLAFLLNARPVLRLGLRREPNALVGSITVRGRLWNLLSIGLALVLLGSILGYAFVENFRVVPSHVAEMRHLTMEEVRGWGRVDSNSTVWLHVAPLASENPTP